MKSNLSRVTGALVLLACVLVAPLRAQKAEPMPDEPRPGWRERAVKMEAELKALQAEAAKNPSRPAIAELQQELDQMHDARISRQSQATRLQGWLTGSFGLNLVLTLALLWALLRCGGGPTRATQA